MRTNLEQYKVTELTAEELQWRRAKHRQQHKSRIIDLNYRTNYQKKQLPIQRARRSKIKGQIFNHYGAFCNCCKESNPVFLTIDHINGDGTIHRNQFGENFELYRAIVKNDFPDNIQILCWNCNEGRELTPDKVCLHKIFQEPKQTYGRKYRTEALRKMGHKCTCCGEERWAFLAIDHIRVRKEQIELYEKLGSVKTVTWIRHNDPVGIFQVLCHNCNQGKRYCGICPHQTDNTEKTFLATLC